MGVPLRLLTMNNRRSTKQQYNNYGEKIRKLKEAEANDRTQDELRDFIQVRQRSKFTVLPYQRSPSASSSRSPSPRRVTLSPSDLSDKQTRGPRRTTLDVPNTRQRSHSDPSDRPPVAMIPRFDEISPFTAPMTVPVIQRTVTSDLNPTDLEVLQPPPVIIVSGDDSGDGVEVHIPDTPQS